MEKKENFFKVKHLYNRAGFGIAYPELEHLSRKNLHKSIKELFSNAQKITDLSTVDASQTRQQLLIQAGLNGKKDFSPEEKEQRQEIIRKISQKGRDLNIEWIQRMISTDTPLLEKMTLFWHGHFACRSGNPLFSQQLNNIQRKYALGSFKTLLIEVSKSPAMLQYLNNQQNRKNHPNENFARELMELFTIGRGNYTEQDIRESARAFTGWTYNKDGDFEFKPYIHDTGSKIFFGKTGNFDGEAIIDIILEKPATATFICRKLYTFFVSDTPNEAHIQELSSCFYDQQYDIAAVMKKMFEAEWFYSPENTGNKIKSPAELLVGLSREFFVTYNKPQVLIQLQSSLGQYLFNPPNVAGWPGGRSWIDSSSLMLRMKIPSLVLNDGLIDFNAKADPEEEALLAINRKPKIQKKSYINAEANWEKFLNTLPKNCSTADLAAFLLQPLPGSKIKSLTTNSSDLKKTAIEITSTPEYQLC
ncbi:DUF1800 domain-containing protein [Pedobacter sp. HMWF019]|uniref:DUF1800 domain-containing protein n=1 Tax=Pedobacter sp. HMWF019 TaxID=2056856 RepID=UPI000D39199A|nr:DUF1800 domain-containing protein [Pedobacter sp. HMWF019]PTT02391.1 DUF1800 domain-containing protein [Pedobacter sp. HMWF019]